MEEENIYKMPYYKVEQGVYASIEEEIDLPPNHEEMVKFTHLHEVLDANDAKVSKIEMRYYEDNYRGIHAKQDIKAGETILFIPKILLITLEFEF